MDILLSTVKTLLHHISVVILLYAGVLTTFSTLVGFLCMAFIVVFLIAYQFDFGRCGCTLHATRVCVCVCVT